MSATDPTRSYVPSLMLAPRMEQPSQTRVLPLPDALWVSASREALTPTRIPSETTDERASRRTRTHTLAAKECSPAVLPYLLLEGDKRGSVCTRRPWVAVPQDLDAVGLTVDELYQIVDRAFAGVRRWVWPTWSCRDGYASVRVLLFLDREATYEEASDVWWWARDRLIQAGLPEESAKDGEPANDSRAMDGRLFFLPAYPTPAAPGTERWGGAPCRVYYAGSGDHDPDADADDIADVVLAPLDPLLDVDVARVAGQAVRDREEPLHLARWPSVPVPGKGPRKAVQGTTRKYSSETPALTPPSRVDLDAVPMPGLGATVLAWTRANLPRGQQIQIGSVCDPTVQWQAGETALDYRSAMLHHEVDGAVWLHDFRTGLTYVHNGNPPKVASKKVEATVARGGSAEVAASLQVGMTGEPRPSLSNAIAVLEGDPLWRGALYLDERTLYACIDDAHVDAVAAATGLPRDRGPMIVGDPVIVALRVWISRTYGFEPGRETMHDAITHVSGRRRVNHLTAWLDRCAQTWDGRPRLDTWLRDYAGVEDSAITRAYARRFAISAVARAYAAQDRGAEGAKVDTVLILQGEQGARKSTLLRALAGPGGFSDSRIDIGHKDSYMVIRRPWIYEFAELANLTRKEAEDVKQFLSSQVDNFRPPYGRVALDFPRQGVFVGSTNPSEFLSDPTGSRRYWPVSVGTVDVDGLVSARDQLWGEAVRAYRAGERWWLSDEEETLRATHSEQYQAEDPHVERIRAWCGTLRRGRTVTVLEVMEGALRLSPSEYGRAKSQVAGWLGRLGATKERTMIDRVRSTRWRIPDELCETALRADPVVDSLFSPPSVQDQIVAAWTEQRTEDFARLAAAHPVDLAAVVSRLTPGPTRPVPES